MNTQTLLKRLGNTAGAALLTGMPAALSEQIRPGLGLVALGGMGAAFAATAWLAARARTWQAPRPGAALAAVAMASPALALTGQLGWPWGLAVWGLSAAALASFAACDDPIGAMAQMCGPLGEGTAPSVGGPALMPDGRTCTVFDPAHPMFDHGSQSRSAADAGAWQHQFGGVGPIGGGFGEVAQVDFAPGVDFNPTTGLPMLEGSGIDISGTTYGSTNSSSDWPHT